MSDNQHQGYHLVYAALDPKKGLLHMPYEMGRSKKITYLKLFKYAVISSIFFCIFLSLVLISQYFSDDLTIDEIIFNSMIYYPTCIVFSFFFMACFAFGKNNLRELGGISESVFQKLNFSQVGEQDFYSSGLIDSEGVYPSIMHYRKNLKGKDPYPEDYFDKKRDG